MHVAEKVKVDQKKKEVQIKAENEGHFVAFTLFL